MRCGSDISHRPAGATFNKSHLILSEVRLVQIMLTNHVIVTATIVLLRVRRKVLQHADLHNTMSLAQVDGQKQKLSGTSRHASLSDRTIFGRPFASCS